MWILTSRQISKRRSPTVNLWSRGNLVRRSAVQVSSPAMRKAITGAAGGPPHPSFFHRRVKKAPFVLAFAFIGRRDFVDGRSRVQESTFKGHGSRIAREHFAVIINWSWRNAPQRCCSGTRGCCCSGRPTGGTRRRC